MQKRLLIDTFDGTLKPKTLGQALMYYLWKIVEGTTTLEKNEGLYARKADHKKLKKNIKKLTFNEYDGNLLELAEMIKGSLSEPIKMTHAMTMPDYKKDPSKNYVFSRPLVQTLQRTKANVTLSILPDKDFCYYLEMPGLLDEDKTEVGGILLTHNIHPEGQRRLSALYYTPLTKGNIGDYLKHFARADNLPKDVISDPETIRILMEKKLIEVRCIAIPFNIDDRSERFDEALMRSIRQFPCEDDYKDINGLGFSTFRTIINGLLYIMSGEEELKVEHNEFSPKAKKREAQEKIYTKKGFVHLGKNVKFFREYSEDGYYWAPFFRKRPGAKDDRKTVYVKGHFKYFRNKGDEEAFA